MRDRPGRKNVYTCTRCHERIVTVDRDVGVTPMMLACKVNRCSDKLRPGEAMAPMMMSSGYCVDQTLEPTHEWYRPEGPELETLSEAMRDHVTKGGLELRASEKKENTQ